jgi:hypothetical protein
MNQLTCPRAGTARASHLFRISKGWKTPAVFQMGSNVSARANPGGTLLRARSRDRVHLRNEVYRAAAAAKRSTAIPVVTAIRRKAEGRRPFRLSVLLAGGLVAVLERLNARHCGIQKIRLHLSHPKPVCEDDQAAREPEPENIGASKFHSVPRPAGLSLPPQHAMTTCQTDGEISRWESAEPSADQSSCAGKSYSPNHGKHGSEGPFPYSFGRC